MLNIPRLYKIFSRTFELINEWYKLPCRTYKLYFPSNGIKYNNYILPSRNKFIIREIKFFRSLSITVIVIGSKIIRAITHERWNKPVQPWHSISLADNRNFRDSYSSC